MHEAFVLTLIAPNATLPNPEALVSPPMVSQIARAAMLAEAEACDLFFHEMPEAPALAHTRERCEAARVDMVLQPSAFREKKLLISDMDSTMIAQECIDELADKVGLKPKVAAITERAMNGELDFRAALRERVALLAGLPETVLEQVYREQITLMPGAKTLVSTMKARGASAHLVSGGFTFFTSRVAAALGFDSDDANRLELAEGKLTGQVHEPILDKDSKLQSLVQYANAQAISLGETLAVGDGANDLPMLMAAGLGVAYRAKPVVAAQAKASIRFHDLSALLYLQGIAKNAWVA